jgi:thioredoxin-related protein
MLLSLRNALLATLLLAPSAISMGGGDGWMDDLGPALDKARLEGKDVLVDFTGSDWCGWCIKLDDEVFSKSEFRDWADDRFVLVALDFPRDGGKTWKAMSPELRKRNTREQEAFEIQGFPTIILLNAEGVAYGRTGYQAGGPKPYIKHLAELQASEEREAANAATARLAVVGDDPIEAELEAVYELVGRVSATRVEGLLAKARTLDPEDSRGLLARHALNAFAREHLATQDVDVEQAADALEDLAEQTPSATGVAAFHFYRGLLAVDRGEMALANASLGEMDRIGGLPAQYREVLVGRIKEQAPAR